MRDTESRNRLVKERRAAGLSFSAIAAELGITAGQAKYASSVQGLSKRRSDYETRIHYVRTKLVEKKCLKCGDTVLLEKVHFLCFTCKMGDDF